MNLKPGTGLIHIIIFNPNKNRFVADDIQCADLAQSLLDIGFPGEMGEHHDRNGAISFATFLVNRLNADVIFAENPRYRRENAGQNAVARCPRPARMYLYGLPGFRHE